MKLKALLMMWVLAGVFFAAQGWAVPVSYIVKGTLGMVPFYDQELIPFAPGDVFTVSYTFNDAMDQLLDAENSSYNLTGFSFSITSDGNDYSTNILETTSYPNFVLHQNDYYDLYDSAQLTAFSGALNEGTFALNAAIIYARDASKSVLTSPVGAFPDTVNENDFTQFGYFFSDVRLRFCRETGGKKSCATG